MFKRVMLFIVTNLAIVFVLGIVAASRKIIFPTNWPPSVSQATPVRVSGACS